MEEVGWSLSSSSSEELMTVRRRIDQIDMAISALLSERLQLAREVRDLKAELELPIYDPVREAEVRNRVSSAASDVETAIALQNIYDGIMEQSRLLQAGKPGDAAEKSAEARPSITYFPRVLVIGLGLIGGALAHQIKRCLPKTTILAVDKQEIIDCAMAEKAIHAGSENPRDWLHGASLIILAASPQTNLQILQEIAPHLNKGQLIIDVSSTKTSICAMAESLDLRGADFIGGHPFFGSEKSGFENSRSVQVKNKLFCLVPGSKASQISIKRLSRWLSALQMRVEIQDATSHDHISARTSHLVQLLAVALGNCLAQNHSRSELENIVKLSGPSFSQIARLMSSPPEMWLQILSQNREAINCSMEELVEQLKILQAAIQDSDQAAIKRLFHGSSEVRSILNSLEQGG